MNNNHLMQDSIFKIGEVISVDGRKVKVKVDKSKNSSHILYQGELLKNISVGSYIKIIKGFTKIIGKVEGEFINEDKPFLGKEYGKQSDKILRTLQVSMLGYFNGEKFERGIKELPLVYDECFLLDNREFEKVHDFIRKGDKPLEIGSLALEKGQKINIGVNSLFASHIGIFGNTGSGKSYTLAKIYETLFKRFQDQPSFVNNTKFFLFDFNGEYINKHEGEEDNVIVAERFKNIYDLSTRMQSPRKFPITEDEINDINFWSIYLSATEKTQTPFLKRAIDNSFYSSKFNEITDFRYAIRNILEILIDNKNKVEKGDIQTFLKEIHYVMGDRIQQLTQFIDDLQAHLIFNSTTYKYEYNNGTRYYEESFPTCVYGQLNNITAHLDQISPLEKIRLKIIFQYYYELARFDLNSEHISPLLKRLKRIEDLDKVITIGNSENTMNFNVISLKNVNAEMKKILPLLICKQIYDKQKQQRETGRYLNIIIDEAHNILSHISERESSTWKDYRLETFEEIIKEGRKFGVFLTISSQRPSDISPTIISQLHNYFLHRLINNNDILAVEKTISYLDKVSFEYLPILPTGTCIFAGLAAQVPVVLDVGKIESGFEPKSETIDLVMNWIS